MFKMSQMSKRSRPCSRWFFTLHSNGLPDTIFALQVLFMSGIDVFQRLIPNQFRIEFRCRNRTDAISLPLFQNTDRIQAFRSWTFVASCSCESGVVKIQKVEM